MREGISTGKFDVKYLKQKEKHLYAMVSGEDIFGNVHEKDKKPIPPIIFIASSGNRARDFDEFFKIYEFLILVFDTLGRLEEELLYGLRGIWEIITLRELLDSAEVYIGNPYFILKPA